MSIQAKVTPGHSGFKFPKLMVSKVYGQVVLFIGARVGTTVTESAHPGTYGIGHFSSEWCMDAFDDFTGSITLVNSNGQGE